MNIDRRITNGLAWAGVALIIGVPTADFLSAQFLGDPARGEPARVAVIAPTAPMPAPLSQRPDAPAARPEAAVVPARPATAPTPAAEPVAKPASQAADAVDAFVQSGRALPSYIRDANAPAAPAPMAATTPAATRPVISTDPSPAAAAPVDPIEVAAIPPQKVPPVPMPLSMRPAPVSVALAGEPIVIPPGIAPAMPPAVVGPPVAVTARDLQDWETGPLADFLAQRQGGNAYVDPNYDSDGFFLDEGPNRPRRDRIIGREADPFLFFSE